MRQKLLAALMLFVLTGLPACSGGTQTCIITGLIVGQTYQYGYADSNGNVITGAFEAEATTHNIPGVDASINCASVGVARMDLPLIAEGPIG